MLTAKRAKAWAILGEELIGTICSPMMSVSDAPALDLIL